MPAAVGANGARWVGLNLAINRYPYVGNNPQNWGDPNGDIQLSPRVRACFGILCIALKLGGPEVRHMPDFPESPGSECVVVPIAPRPKK